MGDDGDNQLDDPQEPQPHDDNKEDKGSSVRQNGLDGAEHTTEQPSQTGIRQGMEIEPESQRDTFQKSDCSSHCNDMQDQRTSLES